MSSASVRSVEFTKPWQTENDVSWDEIYTSSLLVVCVESGCRRLYESTANAVTTAENKPAWEHICYQLVLWADRKSVV